MTKRQWYLSTLTVIALGIYFGKSFRKEPNLKKNSFSTASTPRPLPTAPKKLQVNTERLEIDGKKVVGLRPGKEKEDIQTLKVANTPTSDWAPALEETLRLQGGKSLKEVNFNKVDSFVWVHEGLALFVESIIVTLKNDRDVETTFRVLVDAQTGKILKNWDQPVIDPVNPRENFKIKVDPRYH